MENHFNVLLQKTTFSLAAYLEKILPTFLDDWWNDGVLNVLTYQQQRRAKERETESLRSLDLAALLRVLDQNWYQISSENNLSNEARHFVKEMQTVRNRWSHMGSEAPPLADQYRDMDTLYRFCVVIEADSSLLSEIKTQSTSLLTINNPAVANEDKSENLAESDIAEPAAEFSPGQIVVLKSNPDIRGAVVSVIPGKQENRFLVFADGETRTFYASQLEVEDSTEDNFEFLTCDEFHAYLSGLQIRFPGLSTLYSLNAARIDYIPYQFRPVLKFIKSDRPRLLIADGVGVGKTIEAGLILRELQARRDINSVLIICPRPLVTERKWEKEMKRFEERFVHLDGPNLRICIDEMDNDGVWPDRYQRSILPYSLFDESLLYGTGASGKKKPKIGMLNLDPPPRFDLVIVDEAHHIRNQDTFRHKAVRFFCDHAEAVVFLTATPIQMGNQDLFVLLNTLRPDLIIDQKSFEHMSEPNPFINQAIAYARAQGDGWAAQAKEALDKAASTPWGNSILRHNPEFNRVQTRIVNEEPSQEDRVQLITDLEDLHTFSGIINRTRRRDIGTFTTRKSETVAVDFTPAQKDLHDELLQVQATIFSRVHGDINVKFMMTTIRRQAASCLFGLVPFLDDILSRHLDELSWDEADNSGPVPNIGAIENIEAGIKSILEKARALDSSDPKLEALRKILRDKQKMPNNKAIVFSSFRHTLRYLHDNLKIDGFRVEVVHGGTLDDDRVTLRRRFEMEADQEECLDVLLFSEIGCEGLDYQFCDCIVNYDLPWNPMRVEQRIGRIDRMGQKSETVAIVNLITPGTVDADIYERCLMRIGVFENALGGGEEILGEITREIRNIAENYSLSDEDRNNQFQQLADNKIRLIQEQDELEQKQVELFGIQLPKDQIKKEVDRASSFWLSSNSIQRLVSIYLQKVSGEVHEFILGDKPLKTLRLSQDARAQLLEDLHKAPRKKTSVYKEWEKWLKGGDQHLLITFDSDCATNHPEAVFVMPLHPLALQASSAMNFKKSIFSTLKVKSNLVPTGTYEFAIYQWRFLGLKEDQIIRPVASNEVVTSHLSSLLEIATEDEGGIKNVSDSSKWDDLDAQHHQLWTKARMAHQRQIKELVEYRRESLATSHRARIALLDEQLTQSANEKIRKMRESQIFAAETDYARHLQALDIATERAEVTAESVAYGIIKIEGE